MYEYETDLEKATKFFLILSQRTGEAPRLGFSLDLPLNISILQRSVTLWNKTHVTECSIDQANVSPFT